MPASVKFVIACWSVVVINNLIGFVLVAMNGQPQSMVGAILPVFVSGQLLKGLLERSNSARRSVRAISIGFAFMAGLFWMFLSLEPNIPWRRETITTVANLLGLASVLLMVIAASLSTDTATEWFRD